MPARTIEIVISPTGAVTLQTKGYSGSDCLQASRNLEKALGVVANDVKTGEFHQPATTEQHVQQ